MTEEEFKALVAEVKDHRAAWRDVTARQGGMEAAWFGFRGDMNKQFDNLVLRLTKEHEDVMGMLKEIRAALGLNGSGGHGR